MKRIGIYSGMLDPLHNGHLWVIEEAAKLFDELHIVIGPNPRKVALFSEKERLDMLRAVMGPLPCYKTLILPDKNLAEYANRQTGDVFIIRGMRNGMDFLYEEGILNCMRTRTTDVGYIYVIPPKNLRNISSSMIKSLCEQNWWGGVEKCVPCAVFERLAEKWHHKQVAEIYGGKSAEKRGIMMHSKGHTINDIEDVPGRGIYLKSSSGHHFEMEDLFSGYEPSHNLEAQRAYFDKAVKVGLFQLPTTLQEDQVRCMIDSVPFEVVMSLSFHLRKVPVSKLTPTGNRYLPCSRSLGPIIVDETNPELPEHFQKGPVLILEGKHRYLDAVQRGEKDIMAWVGYRALKYLDDQNTA